MITLYGIGNCDTIRKTRKWLTDQGVEFDFHDYKKEGCSEKLAKQFLKQFSVEEVINKRGTTWRGLPQESKDNLTAGNAPQLMQQYPALIKRPLLCINNEWLLGYDTDHMQRLINQ